MKIYTVQQMDKIDYDFSVGLMNHGCFINKEAAKRKAKLVYENMQIEYEDKMKRYADEADVASGMTDVEEDDENGYYRISFGYDEDYECHSVAVDEHELSCLDKNEIYSKTKREYLIEDLKSKAIEMEYNPDDFTDEEWNRLADYAEDCLGNNDGLWESYWMCIEYAFEHI